MNPVAYTYDWGLTTDISRINQSRICGKLGIEHVISVSKYIKKKGIYKKKYNGLASKPPFRNGSYRSGWR